MKKAIALLLITTMLLLLACSCAAPADEAADTTTPSAENTDTAPSGDANTPNTSPSSAETTASKYEIEDSLPSLNYEGDVVKIISRGRSWCRDEVTVEDMNGEPINDAIYNRNLAVEGRIGIKIDNFLTSGNDNYEISNIIRTQVNSGSHEYDLLANSVYSTIMYTGEGLFQNVLKCDYLDLESPWWAQGFNEAASFGNAQYFLSGAITLSTYRFIFVTFCNRNIFADHGIDMPYEVVNSGKWTLDYQYEISCNIYEDRNGNNTKDVGDKFGFVTNANTIGVDPYWSSCDMPILVKTSENYYEYAMDIDRLSDAVNKINHLIWENDGAYSVAHKADDAEQDDIAEMFANGDAAMATLRLIAAESAAMRGMSDDYGIVPVPKLDESQTRERSYAHDSFTAFAIPATVVDDRLQQMGAVLEALAAESYRSVIPAYYEITLKDKYCNDPESRDMLDKIINDWYIDPGILYTKQIQSAHQKLRTFIGSNINNVASTMKAISRLVPKSLDTLMDGLKRVEENG